MEDPQVVVVLADGMVRRVESPDGRAVPAQVRDYDTDDFDAHCLDTDADGRQYVRWDLEGDAPAETACAVADELRHILRRGSTVAMVEVRRGRAGDWSDHVVIASHEGEPLEVTDAVAAVTGMRVGASGGVRVSGGQVDRTMLLCCNLSRALHGDDYAINRIRI